MTKPKREDYLEVTAVYKCPIEVASYTHALEKYIESELTVREVVEWAMKNELDKSLDIVIIANRYDVNVIGKEIGQTGRITPPRTKR